MTPLDRLASWLCCPVCGDDLETAGGLTLGCANGHRHDVNKRGYVSLLGGGSKLVGDSAEMLDARDLVLEGGAFGPIAAAVAAESLSSVHASRPPRVLDAGAGTGYYLRATLEAAPSALGLAMDLSPTAVARAVRLSPRTSGLVADTWRPLPIRSRTVDTILDVFAPRNLPEFHRVLRPDGTLIVVVPRADHLASLRGDGTMLDIPADKAEEVIAASEALYAPLARKHVAYSLPLTDALRTALAAMGPSARHPGATPTAVDSTSVSVDVLRLARR